MNENVIEWLDDEDTISVTFHQKRFVNKIKRLANIDENVTILAENQDNSILAHLPISYLKLSPKRKDNISVERKAELAERMKTIRPRSKSDPTSRKETK